MTYYYIATFQNISDVMKAESIAGKYFELFIVPIPSRISQGCGLALRFLSVEKTILLSYLSSFPIQGTLYQMGSEKNEGEYPLELLITFPKTTQKK